MPDRAGADIMNIMRCFFILSLHHQAQPFQLTSVLQSGGHNVNPRGIDAAVSQHVRQLRDILFHRIEYSGEQLAQIVWKYLAGPDSGGAAQPFHPSPDTAPA